MDCAALFLGVLGDLPSHRQDRWVSTRLFHLAVQGQIEKGTPDTRHLQDPYLEVILSHLAPAGLPVPHSRCSAKSGGPLVSLDFGLSVVFCFTCSSATLSNYICNACDRQWFCCWFFALCFLARTAHMDTGRTCLLLQWSGVDQDMLCRSHRGGCLWNDRRCTEGTDLSCANLGFFMYLHCVTAVADAEHECANAGPGVFQKPTCLKCGRWNGSSKRCVLSHDLHNCAACRKLCTYGHCFSSLAWLQDKWSSAVGHLPSSWTLDMCTYKKRKWVSHYAFNRTRRRCLKFFGKYAGSIGEHRVIIELHLRQAMSFRLS